MKRLSDVTPSTGGARDNSFFSVTCWQPRRAHQPIWAELSRAESAQELFVLPPLLNFKWKRAKHFNWRTLKSTWFIWEGALGISMNIDRKWNKSKKAPPTGSGRVRPTSLCLFALQYYTRRAGPLKLDTSGSSPGSSEPFFCRYFWLWCRFLYSNVMLCKPPIVLVKIVNF